jgi:hypothetical protein
MAEGSTDPAIKTVLYLMARRYEDRACDTEREIKRAAAAH